LVRYKYIKKKRGLMMEKRIFIIFLIFILVCLIGCESPLFKSLVQEQEWSDNYSLMDGVRCTAPEMIDGDLNTSGKTLFPEKVYGKTVFGGFPSAEVDIILPERKSIRKIVIHSEELPSFKVLASTGEKDNWKLIKEFDNNTQKEIIIRTSIVTDTIKIRAKAISTFEGLDQGVGRGGLTTVRSSKVTEPEIQEIELYGFK
jgi:hypothetical protein